MSPPLTITGPWRTLVSHAGGVTALAEALGCSRSALNHWIRGERQPNEIARRAVTAWARRRGLASPFAEAA